VESKATTWRVKAKAKDLIFVVGCTVKIPSLKKIASSYITNNYEASTVMQAA